MSEDKKNRLYEAVRKRTLEDIQAAFEACDAKERKLFGPNALRLADRDSGSRGLEILNREASRAQRVEFLMERGLKPYEKDINGDTVFTEALSHENFAVADYLLSPNVASVYIQVVHDEGDSARERSN